MLLPWNRTKAPVEPWMAIRGLWTAAADGFLGRAGGVAVSLRLQRGLSLIESIAAVAIIGISVVGSVVLLGATVSTASSVEGDLGLIQIIRSQVETIQSAPYNDDPSQYPLIVDIPSNVTLTFESMDPVTKYKVNGVDLGQVIQQIEVTAEKDEKTASMIFYKIKTK